MKKELTEEQKIEIEKVTKKFGKLIAKEDISIKYYDARIFELRRDRLKHTDKVDDYKKKRFDEIGKIKDSDRIKKYKNIEVIIKNTYDMKLPDNVVKLGNYSFYETDLEMYITVESETPTQYRLKVSFNKKVSIYNPNNRGYNGWSGRGVEYFRCNIKKLNLKDFLSEYSTGFKREVNISNLVD